MSDRHQENASRISDYLENKLSPDERETFKRALTEDDQLRLQYVDALMNRARGGGGVSASAIDTTGIGSAGSGERGGGASGVAGEGGVSPGGGGGASSGEAGGGSEQAGMGAASWALAGTGSEAWAADMG
ncbi:MAG TPA: hypothetical protein VN616_09420, partial [Puia sp.]|nr:hypothetical protein [Puia sp.]